MLGKRTAIVDLAMIDGVVYPAPRVQDDLFWGV